MAISRNNHLKSLFVLSMTVAFAVSSESQLRGSPKENDEVFRELALERTRQPLSEGIAFDIESIINANSTVCGDLKETICSIPVLEQTCRALLMTEDSLLDGVGAFFAPVDLGWDQLMLSSFVLEDLRVDGVLENLILYHGVSESMANATNSSDADFVFEIDDLECNSPLTMANGVSTNALCMGSLTYLVGDGNLPVRTLPRIISEDYIETCVGDVQIYLIDQVILGSLPLQPLATGEPANADACPIAEPDFSDRCSSSATNCNYNHIYTGCSWDRLSCTWTKSCSCENGTWMCMVAGLAQCGDFVGGEFVSTLPEGLPWGQSCDPDAALPTAPLVVEGRLSDECPPTPQYGDVCSGSFEDDLYCEYDHIYTGCSWNELQCAPITGCTCEGTWACWSAAMLACDPSTTPSDLPWGQSCSPSDPLPLPNDNLAVAALARDIP